MVKFMGGNKHNFPVFFGNMELDIASFTKIKIETLIAFESYIQNRLDFTAVAFNILIHFSSRFKQHLNLMFIRVPSHLHRF